MFTVNNFMRNIKKPYQIYLFINENDKNYRKKYYSVRGVLCITVI